MFVASFHFKWEGSSSVLLILKILFWNSFWYNAAWTRCIWLNLANLGFLLSFYCFLPRMAVAPSKAVGPLFHYLASWLAGSSHSTKPMRLVGHSVWYQIITIGFDVMASLALTQDIGEELTAHKLVRPNTYSTFFSALRVYWKPSIFFVCLLR